ncbi:MAG: PQQ-binding-like beta-propeller repeat protein [Thermoanaerobaculia bacterium]
MSIQRFVTLLPILAVTVVTAAATARAQDWPQWRGPHRDGTTVGLQAPAAWPETLRQRWRLEVGGGHASPVLAGDTVYVLSREGDEEVARAVALADGQVRWRRGYPAPYKMSSAATAHGKGPKATPAVAGGRLHTLGISGILSTFDAATGELVWRRAFGDRFKTTSPLYGTAASPVVDGGRLIAHVGGHHDGALIAFDAATGEEIWALAGDGPGYASPIVSELGGRHQVITQTDGHVVGVDAGDGTLLWKIPFTTPWDQNVVTPVESGGLLIIAGLEQPTRAYRLVAEDGGVRPEEVWANPDVTMYMSTPTAIGDRLFGLSPKRSGQLFALEVATGKLLHTSAGRDGDNAALVAADDRLLVLNDRAELMVIDPGADSLAPQARYEVSTAATWAHPLVTDHGVVIKDATTVTLFAFEAQAATSADSDGID